MSLKGIRVQHYQDVRDGAPGTYWHENDELWAKLPTEKVIRITDPPWSIVEEDDGTVTVIQSIHHHASPTNPEWHGWLSHGEWSEVNEPPQT